MLKMKAQILCPKLMPSRERPPGTLTVNKVKFIVATRETESREQWDTPIRSWGIMLGFGFMVIDCREAPRKCLSVLECMLSESRNNLRIGSL